MATGITPGTDRFQPPCFSGLQIAITKHRGSSSQAGKERGWSAASLGLLFVACFKGNECRWLVGWLAGWLVLTTTQLFSDPRVVVSKERPTRLGFSSTRIETCQRRWGESFSLVRRRGVLTKKKVVLVDSGIGCLVVARGGQQQWCGGWVGLGWVGEVVWEGLR